jgi:RNA polymerase sigma-70 factor (ECF subfamily)
MHTSRATSYNNRTRYAFGGNMSDERRNNEIQLISSAKQGDDQAFAALFNLHKRRVYSLCLHMSKDVAEAEDLTQDAFMRVFRKLDTFRGDARFSTWLYRIAVNTVLAKFRKCKSDMLSINRDIRVDSSFQRKEVSRGDPQLLGVIDRITLARAIEELPPGCRTVFILHDVEGHEHHEVAELLGCSVGNSKAQLHKARMKIRTWLLLPRTQETKQSATKPDAQNAIRASKVKDAEFADAGSCLAFRAAKAS